CMLRRRPVQVRRSERGRPFQLKVPVKNRLNLQRVLRFHVEQDHGALFAHGNEKCFVHAERISRVQNRGGFRPHRNRPRQCLRRQDSSFSMKFQVKLAENLQRVHPRFHAARFISQQPRACSRDWQKFPWTHCARKLQFVHRAPVGESSRTSAPEKLAAPILFSKQRFSTSRPSSPQRSRRFLPQLRARIRPQRQNHFWRRAQK